MNGLRTSFNRTRQHGETLKMITHIRMKNFKSWQDSGKVKLAPLTSFFGTNSSGKSSLLQMLLLLKQTAERKDVEEVIFFGDENSYVNLGEFREVVHGHISEETIELEFSCRLKTPLVFRHPRVNHEVRASDITFKTSFHGDQDQVTVPQVRYSIMPLIDLTVHWKKNRISFEDSHGLITGFSTFNSRWNCFGTLLEEKDPRIDTYISEYRISEYSSAAEQLFCDVHYLGPTRVDPRRNYPWQGEHPKHIKHWGDQTVDALLSARVRKLKTLNRDSEVTIDDKISTWLQKMELAHTFSLDWKSQGTENYEFRIQKTPNSPPVTLVDMGYGLSQFLPVLVLCYYASEGSTLILEQPGIHLHPKVQSQLADLLIEVVNERSLQILVESHSEHLLTRLQRRIAEKQIPEKNVALYFCRNNDGASTIEKLEVDEESGDIKNWPENFFGDVMGDMFAMTDKQVESIAEKGTEG